MQRYEDFKAWQLCAELNTKVFKLTSSGASYRNFKYRDNIRDAADSAQRNFPEGFGRFAPGEFARFLDHSRASLLEVKNELGRTRRPRRAPRCAHEPHEPHELNEPTNPRTPRTHEPPNR